MLQQPADVVAAHLAGQRVAVLIEELVDPINPERLVDVHAGAVVLEQRLGHEGHGVAVLIGDVLDDVLVEHHLVGHVDQGLEAHVNLGLAGRGDLVVLHLDLDAGLDELQHHVGAEILELVHRWHREVAALVAGTESEVGAAVPTGGAVHPVRAAIPDTLFRIDVVEPAVGGLAEAPGT